MALDRADREELKGTIKDAIAPIAEASKSQAESIKSLSESVARGSQAQQSLSESVKDHIQNDRQVHKQLFDITRNHDKKIAKVETKVKVACDNTEKLGNRAWAVILAILTGVLAIIFSAVMALT